MLSSCFFLTYYTPTSTSLGQFLQEGKRHERWWRGREGPQNVQVVERHQTDESERQEPVCISSAFKSMT